MNIHIVMHEEFEAPGAIADWIRQNGHHVSYTRLYEGGSFPAQSSFDFLVVMGGPQSPSTTLAECPHFDAAAETAFVKETIEADKHVLGVCLGAQFIGEALGAKFDHSPNREIGVFDVTLTDAAKHNSIFAEFPNKFPVGHWHGDMPGLTPESRVIAVSEGCPRQIVCYSPKVYGFQCHFEFMPEAIEGMIQNNQHELDEYRGRSFIETAEQLRAHKYDEMNTLLFKFLDAFIEA